MLLSTMILIAGAAALVAFLVAQFLWTDAPEAAFRRRRRRLLGAAALLFPLLAFAHHEARRIEAPPPEPELITIWPDEPVGTDPLPPPPPPPVNRQEDCPPGTTLSGGLCRSDIPVEE
ncbi:MAG TPA: hypothetical protein VGB08_00825 [Allosphingosinicella sp.]|jgi:hypothetical protein